jgi:SAM-dependent methyltransferase
MIYPPTYPTRSQIILLSPKPAASVQSRPWKMSMENAFARLPAIETCIDCGELQARPHFARMPKDSNIARRMDGHWPTGRPAPTVEEAYGIYRCVSCGSVFLHPTHFEESRECYRAARYFSGYYPLNIHVGGHPSDGEHKFPQLKRRAQQERARWLVALVQRHKREMATIGRVCDVGCATGWFVQGCQDLGLDAFGVELSPQALRAQERCGADHVHHGTFETADFGGQTFDVITLFQTIEHIIDAGATLSAMKARLAVGGVIVMTCPNDIAGYRPLLWRKYWWLIPPMHVRFFDQRTMRNLLERSGLRMVGYETEGSLGADVFMVLDWLLRRAHLGMNSSGRPYKILRQIFVRSMRPLDYLIRRTVGHSELIVVASSAAA